MRHEINPNESRNLTPRDSYHIINNEINSSNNNNSIRSILTPPHSHSHSRLGNQETEEMNSFLVMQSDLHTNMLNSTNDMYGLSNPTVNQQLSQNQSDVDTIPATAVPNTDHSQHFLVSGSDINSQDQNSILNSSGKPMHKKRGRKKKISQEIILPTLERYTLKT